MPSVRRAGIYARISRDEEGEGLGVERQRADCAALIEQHGWTLVDAYVDNDVSASTASRKPRPQYERLLADAAAGRIDTIVAYSNSRLTRRPREWIDLIDLANGGSVDIHTVVSGSHDLSTADGRFTAMILAHADAVEAERTSERLKRQKADRAARGLAQGGRYRVFGYTRQFEPIGEEAEIVREIFTRRASGQSATSIGKDLAARGLTTAAGKPWTQSSVGKLISRPGYAGLREFKGEILGPTSYPALVEEYLWRAANGEAAKASAGTNARRWVLSGLAVCGRCSTAMTGNGYIDGYRCNRNWGGCGRTKIKTAWLEGPVVSLMLARQTKLAESSQPRGARLKVKPFDFLALDARIQEVRRSFAAGALDVQDMTAILSDLRQQRRAAEQAASTGDAALVHGPVPSIAGWLRADVSQRRVMLAQHLRVVAVGPRREVGPGRFDPERLTITWANGEVQIVTQVDLDEVPYWNVDAGSWHMPAGLPIARLELGLGANPNAARQ